MCFFCERINIQTYLTTAGIDYGQFPDPGIGYLNIMLEDESWIGSAIIILDDSLVEHNENFTVR